MKIQGFILSFMFATSMEASTLSDLKKESQNSLYFTLPLSSYTISLSEDCHGKTECPVDLRVTLATSEITVITDRPVRDHAKIKMSEFETFASHQDSSLVFSLSVPQGENVKLYNFTKDKVTADLGTKTFRFTAKMNNQGDALINDFKDQTVISGDGAVLNVEG